MIDLSHITPMGFRYPLQHREPAAGFAARLAALNGRRMNDFLRDMLIQPRSIDKGEDEAVRTLAAVGGVDGDDLVRYSPYPHLTEEYVHVVAGETIGYRRVFRTYFRFCPHCVAEDMDTFEGPEVARPWLRLEWTLAAIRSCRKHNVYLTVTSPIRRRFEPFDFAETMETHLTVRTADVEDMLQKLKGALTAPQVMEQLKIPRNHLAALIEIGALKTVTGSENFRDAKHRFAQSDIDDMIRRLLDGAEMVEEIGPRQMSVIDARKVATTTLEQVLSMVFEGKLNWKGRRVGQTDYDALLIDADEVIARVRSEPKGTGLTRIEISKLIPGLHQRAVTALIDQGKLKTDMQFSPNARRDVEVVTADSIEAFRQSYVTLGELIKLSGLHLKRIKALFRRVGIDVCEDPEVVVAWLYDRQRVDALLAAHPGFWGYTNGEAEAVEIK